MSLITKSTYLRGPKGERGLAGPRGERGLAGAQGLQGIQGPDSDSQYIRGQFSGSGNITYNFNTGVIGFTNPGYATTTYVDIAIANLVNNAPAVLDTIKEIADAINNDPNFYNNKLSISGGTMTGALILNADPIANLGAATKQYVDAATLGITVNDSDDVPEGDDNLYYTNTRARTAISATGNLNYNSGTGVMSYTEPGRTIDDLTDVDTSTNAPQEGESLVWDSGSSKWKPGQAAVNISTYNYDATAGQLIFTGQELNQQPLSYTDYDLVQVFKNGVLLRRNIQYTLNDSGYVDYVAMGDSVELSSPAALDDWIYIIVTNTTGSNPDSATDGGEYADVMEPGLDGGSY